MAMTDQEIVLQAVHEVRVILGAYIEPGPRDCDRALNSILGVMDRNDVIAAVERLDRRRKAVRWWTSTNKSEHSWN